MRLLFFIFALIPFAIFSLTASAAEISPFQFAEEIRVALLDAQLNLKDFARAQEDAVRAKNLYAGEFAKTILNASPRADERVRAGLNEAQRAVETQDALLLADARAQVWTALLAGGYAVVENAITTNDARTAQTWLPLREFRRATRFSRPNADATRAVEQFAQNKISGHDALASVRADVLDTYQARLKLALDDALAAEGKNYAARRVENVSLAAGYFEILAPSFAQQRGAENFARVEKQFSELRSAARENKTIASALNTLAPSLQSFRAAPLTPQEQTRRAGQFHRFLGLVPIEFARGVTAGIVTADFEIQEAITFRDGAEAAFSDLQTFLDARNPEKSARIANLLDELQTKLENSATRVQVADPAQIQKTSDEIVKLVTEISPLDWSQRGSDGDFDVIASMLDQMEQATASGEYTLAESARLEAYAIMEMGPEARLVAAAPQLKTPIEDLFWFGQGDEKGLAYLIRERAPIQKIKASRDALDTQLALAQTELANSAAPAAVATNAGIIVFREGLEAVLILAALMSSLKFGEMRKYRKGMWIGVAFAFVVTIITWLVAGSLLNMLARYGETLEAVVSLIAVGVLLLILNWFFHKVYWTGWIGSFQTRKRAILGQTAGQMLGLAVLGFTSVYREGFEVVLFLQALVLEAGAATVLVGVAVGLALVILIGIATFVLQAKLPYKKMLIVTGVMIGAVLLVMVGNTVHVMQVIGWMSITPLRFLNPPYWMGIWFGIYPTVETLAAQFLALVYVFGSYYLAERQHERGSEKTRASNTNEARVENSALANETGMVKEAR